MDSIDCPARMLSKAVADIFSAKNEQSIYVKSKELVVQNAQGHF